MLIVVPRAMDSSEGFPSPSPALGPEFMMCCCLEHGRGGVGVTRQSFQSPGSTGCSMKTDSWAELGSREVGIWESGLLPIPRCLHHPPAPGDQFLGITDQA